MYAKFVHNLFNSWHIDKLFPANYTVFALAEIVINEELTNPSRAAFAAQRHLPFLGTNLFDRAETPQLLPRCRWEKFAALANPISAGQMNGTASNCARQL
ncbi:MAG: hypothetical protein MSF32_09705 [Dysosmobacter sp.]|nr:hypothetical protein [Dysosmobacter sp.]